MLKGLGPLSPFHCTVHSSGDKPAGTFTGEDGRKVDWPDHYRVELTPQGQPTLLTIKLPKGQGGLYTQLRPGDLVLVTNARVAGKNGRFSIDMSQATVEKVEFGAAEGQQQGSRPVRPS